MRFIKKLASSLVAVLLVLQLGSGTANALSISWAFMFPVPIPLPVWTVEHPHSLITYGFLFPFWLPLPFYDYGEKGPIEPKFKGEAIPPGTDVYVDGRDAGKVESLSGNNPLIGLPEGVHSLELKNDGRTLYAASFDVKDGAISNVRYDKTPAAD